MQKIKKYSEQNRCGKATMDENYRGCKRWKKHLDVKNEWSQWKEKKFQQMQNIKNTFNAENE